MEKREKEKAAKGRESHKIPSPCVSSTNLEAVHDEPKAFSFRERTSSTGMQVKSQTLREKCIAQ